MLALGWGTGTRGGSPPGVKLGSLPVYETQSHRVLIEFCDILNHHELPTCVILYSIQWHSHASSAAYMCSFVLHSSTFSYIPHSYIFLVCLAPRFFFWMSFFLMSAPRFFSCIFQLKDWYCESIHAHFLECVLKIESQVTMHEELLVYQIFCLSPKKNVETTWLYNSYILCSKHCIDFTFNHC